MATSVSVRCVLCVVGKVEYVDPLQETQYALSDQVQKIYALPIIRKCPSR
jgi:hypothetical protein